MELAENRAPTGVLVRVVNTGEVPTGKAAFLNVLTKVVDLRRSSLNDENINLSSAMLSEDFQALKEKFEDTEIRNTELEKELKSILRKKKGNATSSD